MKVILLADVGKVGQRGTVQEVADGFALNFLVARGLAVQATPEKLAEHAARAKREGEAKASAEASLRLAIESLEGARIETNVRASEKGGLFKAIGPAEIAKLVSAQKQIRLPEEAVPKDTHIKMTGEHQILIRAAGAAATLTLVVAKGA